MYIILMSCDGNKITTRCQYGKEKKYWSEIFSLCLLLQAFLKET